MTQQALLQMVKTAVRQTLEALRSELPGESLVGYALLVDDAVDVLSYVAATRESLAASSEADFLFLPTEWPYDPAQAAFDSANDELRALCGSKLELRLHVDEAFGTLVRALAECRAEGLFEAEVFLSVLSPDPSPYLQSLERASVQALNEPHLVEGWMRAR